MAALDRYNGSTTAAAAALGIPRGTLRSRLERGALKAVETPATWRRHMVIPDCQVKPGVPIDHLEWAGKYAARQRPDTIICIGDFSDLSSLSSFDKNKLQFEGRRLKQDIKYAKKAMGLFMAPILAEPDYKPRLVLTLGNHEHRLSRAIENSPELDGMLSLDDLGYKEFGWEVIPFLEPITIDGVSYCHYYPSGEMGRPVSSARALVNKRHHSAVMGHVQRTDIDFQYDLNGRRLIGLFCGAFYQHDESYLNPIINRSTWRGIWVLNEVRDGDFSIMEVTLDYLKRRYGVTCK